MDSNQLLGGIMEPYNFAADLEDQLCYPAYNPEKWTTRKEWFEWVYDQGYYWITDDYDENGEPRK